MGVAALFPQRAAKVTPKFDPPAKKPPTQNSGVQAKVETPTSWRRTIHARALLSFQQPKFQNSLGISWEETSKCLAYTWRQYNTSFASSEILKCRLLK